MARPRSILYKIDPDTGCWVWQGVCSGFNGYPRVKRNGRLTWAHRWYYEESKGTIPPGWELDHLCRVPKCVNPDHLEPVSTAENQRRGNAVRISWEVVEFIRTHYIPYHPEFGQRALARKYGISHAAVGKVINNISWREDIPAVLGG